MKPKKKTAKVKSVSKIGGGGKLTQSEMMQRRKLIFYYSECLYYEQKKIARLLKIDVTTVKVAMRYWREHPDEMPLDKLPEVEVIRLAQIYKQRLHILELHKRKRKLEKGFLEGKESIKEADMLIPFETKEGEQIATLTTKTVTTCKRFMESQINDIYKQIEEAEKKYSILTGVWQEKTEITVKESLPELIARRKAEREKENAKKS